MLPRLFLLVAAALLGWVLARFLRQLGAGRGAEPRRPREPAPPATAESMVRDRVCGTFIPRSSALTAHAGSEQHYFCSDQCRRTFMVQLEQDAPGRR